MVLHICLVGCKISAVDGYVVVRLVLTIESNGIRDF